MGLCTAVAADGSRLGSRERAARSWQQKVRAWGACGVESMHTDNKTTAVFAAAVVSG
jgi:hypothetical protein